MQWVIINDFSLCFHIDDHVFDFCFYHIMRRSLSFVNGVRAEALWPDRVRPFLWTELVVHRTGGEAPTEVCPSQTMMQGGEGAASLCLLNGEWQDEVFPLSLRGEDLLTHTHTRTHGRARDERALPLLLLGCPRVKC